MEDYIYTIFLYVTLIFFSFFLASVCSFLSYVCMFLLMAFFAILPFSQSLFILIPCFIATYSRISYSQCLSICFCYLSCFSGLFLYVMYFSLISIFLMFIIYPMILFDMSSLLSRFILLTIIAFLRVFFSMHIFNV